MTEDPRTLHEPPVTDGSGTVSNEPARAASADTASAETATAGTAGADTEVARAGVRRARRQASRRRNTIEWIVVIAGALVIAVVIKTFLFQAFYIPSDSMEPTLHVGDRVLVNKLSYRVHDVHQGDIVVFDKPSTQPQTVEGCDGSPVTITPPLRSDEAVHDLIKRVIATEGQTVEQRDGKILVDGRVLVEPYVHATAGVADRTPAFTFPSQCIRVPPGKVFVLGDNRADSSASNVFGPIPETSIVGRAFVRVWPIGDFGGL